MLYFPKIYKKHHFGGGGAAAPKPPLATSLVRLSYAGVHCEKQEFTFDTLPG